MNSPLGIKKKAPEGGGARVQESANPFDLDLDNAGSAKKERDPVVRRRETIGRSGDPLIQLDQMVSKVMELEKKEEKIRKRRDEIQRERGDTGEKGVLCVAEATVRIALALQIVSRENSRTKMHWPPLSGKKDRCRKGTRCPGQDDEQLRTAAVFFTWNRAKYCQRNTKQMRIRKNPKKRGERKLKEASRAKLQEGFFTRP